jgi:hypothetical protein
MEKKISYLNRTYADYKDALIEMSERYYPSLTNSFRDASIASWQIDVAADVADNLSYHIDRVFQETNINSAQEKSSLYAIARNCGVKIPGPKGAMAEVRLTAVLPQENGYGPIIKRGTKFSSGSQQFELLDDVDFDDQFDVNGNSDRTIVPRVSTNGIISGYTVSKLAVVTAGETRIFSQILKASDIKPFMEIILPIEGVMNIESIIVKDGENDSIPTYGVFYGSGCSGITRFYEVDNLAQNKCWIDSNQPQVYNDGTTVGMRISKGVWKTINEKFITEYTDKGYLKVIFGAGNGIETISDLDGSFNQWQMSKILNNNNLGVLPKPNSTIYILYRVGGGSSSNVAKGAINKISYLNADFRKGSNGTQADVTKILNSLKVENTTPSISGKDMPSEAEMRYYIKYHNSAQERCVTIKDYIDRILMLPPKYGTPFRVGVVEENNKIVIYLLGVDTYGKLSDSLPSLLVENIKNYIKEYRMINDYIEIKSGRIINLGFDVDAVIDKTYNKNDVISSIISTIKNYMDINKHIMGEEIYVGDLEKEIGKIDGVINLISLKVINKHGESGYSSSEISQETFLDNKTNESIVDLEASDYILFNDGDTMMEIKNPDVDIRVRIKER